VFSHGQDGPGPEVELENEQDQSINVDLVSSSISSNNHAACSLCLSCSTKDERQRYSPFVAIANVTLDMLREINLAGLKPPPKGAEELIFQVNDPHSIRSNEVGIEGLSFVKDTLRKPDAVAMPLRASGTSWSWKLYSEKYARAKPPNEFPLTWFDCRLALEFKASVDEMEPPPNEWKPCEAPAAHAPFLKPGIAPELLHDGPIIPALPKVSKVHPDLPSAPTVLGGLNNNDRKLASSSRTSASGQKRQRDGGQGGASAKKAKHNEEPTLDQRTSEKDRRLNGAVQLDIYAGQRISSSIMMSHSWNMLIRGRLHSFASDSPCSSFRRRSALHLRFRPVQSYTRVRHQLHPRFPRLRPPLMYPPAL
jgi:hypothetical protein